MSPIKSSFVAVNEFMRPLKGSFPGFTKPLRHTKQFQSASFWCSLSSYRLKTELLGPQCRVDAILCLSIHTVVS